MNQRSIPGRERTYPPTSHLDPAASSVLITGGAGFIGCNLAERLLTAGHRVVIFDNLSRPSVHRNLTWLRARHANRLEVLVADVRDAVAVRGAVAQASHVFHFAAQVAVTSSLVDPEFDFDVNARGTLNVLEGIRRAGAGCRLFFTSTNKVYGALDDLELRETETRYEPLGDDRGIGEERPLSFHSPYGCSKGTADQYVLDYARTYGIPAVVFRMSCIYGPRQFGTEDQGWVAHFLIRALTGESITLYGDGKQVRDVLFVDDLIDAFFAADRCNDLVVGQAFNIGGGPKNTLSLLELLQHLEGRLGRKMEVRRESWRVGDQRYYVSSTQKFNQVTGWWPKVSPREGLSRLHDWLSEPRTRRGERPSFLGSRS